MERFEESFNPFDLANGAADKTSPPPDFDGPVKNRRVTDPLCLLVGLGLWGVATWMGIWSIQEGSYNTFVKPSDYKGRICGFDTDANGDVLPPLLHPVDYLSNGKCVTECPTGGNLEPSSRSDLICKDDDDLLAITGCASGGAISNDLDALITCGGCMYAWGTTQKKYQCLPQSVSDVIEKVNDVAEGQGLEPLSKWTRFKLQSYITSFVNDLHTSTYIVAGSIGGSALLGLLGLVLYLIPRCIPVTVWGSAVLVPFALGGGGAFLWLLSSSYGDDQSGVHSDMKAIIMLILAITSWVFAGIAALSIFILRKNINLSIALTQAGTRAIREIKLCILFPVIQTAFFALFLGIMTLWLIYFSTTAVSIEETDNVFGSEITYKSQKYTMFGHYKFWFMMLVVVWTSSFFVTFGRLVLSHSFAVWYFTPEKDEGNCVSVFGSFTTILMKHTGTVAYASLAMGPIAVARAPFLLVQNCIRHSGMDNNCVDALICSCQCWFFILERFLKFASKNAIVQTAVFGHSFCKSSHESYYLIRRNADNIADAGPVGSLCTFYTRILLCAITCLASYYALDQLHGNNLYSIMSVVVMIGLISWFTIGFFMETVGMSVITLFQCFLADEEMLGNQGSLYVPKEIDEFLARLDETRKAEVRIPKLVNGDNDDNTIESGMAGESIPSNIL